MQIKKISTSITAGPKYKEKGNINVEINIVLKKSSLTIFKDDKLLYLNNTHIGGDHITKDISRGCYLSEIESELIKKDISIINNLDDKLNKDDFLSAKYFSSGNIFL